MKVNKFIPDFLPQLVTAVENESTIKHTFNDLLRICQRLINGNSKNILFYENKLKNVISDKASVAVNNEIDRLHAQNEYISYITTRLQKIQLHTSGLVDSTQARELAASAAPFYNTLYLISRNNALDSEIMEKDKKIVELQNTIKKLYEQNGNGN